MMDIFSLLKPRGLFGIEQREPCNQQFQSVAASGTFPDIGPGQLSFHARSVIIDNPTAAWFWIGGARCHVGPNRSNVVLPIISGSEVAHLRQETPSGESSTITNGAILTATWTTIQLPISGGR
jgi:hypothetical protein